MMFLETITRNVKITMISPSSIWTYIQLSNHGKSKRPTLCDLVGNSTEVENKAEKSQMQKQARLPVGYHE